MSYNKKNYNKKVKCLYAKNIPKNRHEAFCLNRLHMAQKNNQILY